MRASEYVAPLLKVIHPHLKTLSSGHLSLVIFINRRPLDV
jgi:hypothetical protein